MKRFKDFYKGKRLEGLKPEEAFRSATIHAVETLENRIEELEERVKYLETTPENLHRF